MGILNKIEDKLSGSGKHQAEHKQGEQPLYSGNERRSIEQQATSHGAGSGMPGQTMGSSNGGRSQDLRHPVQSATGRSGEGQYGQYDTTGQGSKNLDYNNDGYGEQSGREKTRPHEAVDPRSVRGQQAMYENSGGAHDYPGGQSGEADIGRSHHAGVSNPMGNDDYRTGGRSSLENHHAIPSAGGEKLGNVGSESGRHQQHGGQHHPGRDAAISGGAGVIGMEEYERRNKPTSGRHGHHGHSTHNQSGGSSEYGGQDMGSRSQQDGAYRTYTGRSVHDDNMSGAGSRGTGTNHSRGGGAGLEDEYSSGRHHGAHQLQSGGMNDTASGLPTEKKLGGAYEAGYRDAMAHMEAEK